MRLLPAAVLLLVAGCSGATSTPEPPGGKPRGVEPTPDALPQATFTGSGSGCSNLLAYRASADGTQFAVIELEKDTLGLEIGKDRSVDLGQMPAGVVVSVDVYASAPTEQTYCTDYLSAQPPTKARWIAEAGELTIELRPDPNPGAGQTYRATLRIASAHFVGPERGLAIVIPSIVIEDVRVGWLPG